MKVGYFYYEGFAEFELVLCSLYFREQETLAVTLGGGEVASLERQRFLSDRALCEVDASALDLLVIPGGNPGKLYGNAELREFVERLLRSGGKVAGICGGAELLASLGVLRGKRCTGDSEGVTEKSESYAYFRDSTPVDEDVVVDGNVITGKGKAFIQFAVELARIMGVVKSGEEAEADLRMFRNL